MDRETEHVLLIHDKEEQDKTISKHPQRHCQIVSISTSCGKRSTNLAAKCFRQAVLVFPSQTDVYRRQLNALVQR